MDDAFKKKAIVGGVLVALVVVAIKLWPADPPVTKPGDSVVVETSTGFVMTSATAPAMTGSGAASAGSVVAPVSGTPVDMGNLAAEARPVSDARTALNAGDPRKALSEIERWEHLPEPKSLKVEATLLKIEALTKVPGRKTDALALAMSTRDDPAFAPYQGRIEAITTDAGLVTVPAGGPVR